MQHYQHWIVEQDQAAIVWLGFNRKDATVNTINHQVLDELNNILQEIALDPAIKGLIIYSAKEKGFIAGADVHEFSQFTTPEEITDFLRKGQSVFARLEALAIPTVAMIQGFCMGGGLELALACRYRILAKEEDTRLGLPEIMLGFHPGWGGTVRLPRLIGGFPAITQMILTGQAVSASRAQALGLADAIVPLRHLKTAATYYIQNQPPVHRAKWWQAATNYRWVRLIAAKLIRRQLARKVNQQHYPAPYAVVDFWEKEGCVGERPFYKEIVSVQQLVAHSDTSKNLIRVFGLRERLKSFAKQSTTPVKTVHVIGAGVMGGDIAAWCALRGLQVTLQDRGYAQIAPAIKRAAILYKKKLKQPRLIQAALDRLIPDPEGHGIARADLIIEAVFENLEVKQSIVKMVEEKAPKHAMIATNTSSIPLDDINAVMQNPERLLGIHFFNPVAKMELIEVVVGKKTNPDLAQQACAFVGQIGRLPLPVSSTPGFLVNRVLMPYLLECMQMLAEGYSGRTIDKAATDFGMVMGPVELADTVGLDVCLAVADNLTAAFGGTVPEKLREMVKAGKLGRKTGEGFYRYKNGKPIKPKAIDQKPSKDLANRLILRMVNEAAACLREQVVADSDLLDAGMIFATGFAPFRGGLMHYAQQFKSESLSAVLELKEAV